MQSIKAILVGVFFIIIVGLVMQLAFIFLAVGYNSLARTYSFLQETRIDFRYFLGIPSFLLLMFLGGLVTADIAARKVIWHCFAVALIIVGLMLTTMVDYMEITTAGYVIYFLAFAAILAGGSYWKRKHRTNTVHVTDKVA